jgi:hypothetical protein
MNTQLRGKKKIKVRPDLLWKELLETFLYAALEVFYPALYDAVDLEKKPIFLDKELRIPGMRQGQKITDLLVDVPLKTGGMAFLLLHIEIQGTNTGEPFHVRMYQYSCLITLRLKRPFTALAIRTTQRGRTEEVMYEDECFETRHLFNYRTVFLDQMDENRLLAMKENPVALATVGAIRMLRAGKLEPRRFEYARELLRLLKDRKYSIDICIQLTQFLEGITALSTAKLLEKFGEEMDNLLKEVEPMRIMTPVLSKVLKKKSYEWGKLDGVLEGQQKIARSMLAEAMPLDRIAKFTDLSVEEVEALRTQDGQ